MLGFKIRPRASKGEEDANEGGGVAGGLVDGCTLLAAALSSFFVCPVNILVKDPNVVDKDGMDMLFMASLFVIFLSASLEVTAGAEEGMCPVLARFCLERIGSSSCQAP